MKAILIPACIMFMLSCNARQQKPFNCKLIEEIVRCIDSEKDKVEASKLLDGKISISESQDGKISVERLTNEYNPVLDSLITSPGINDILSVSNDTLLYLNTKNIIVDTFHFFTKECSCSINGRQIEVINDYKKIARRSVDNIIYVISLDSYRGYQCVSLRHSAKGSKKIIFEYLIVDNKPKIKDIVMFSSDYE